VVDREVVVTGCPTGIVQQRVRVYDDWCGKAAVLHLTGRHGHYVAAFEPRDKVILEIADR